MYLFATHFRAAYTTHYNVNYKLSEMNGKSKLLVYILSSILCVQVNNRNKINPISMVRCLNISVDFLRFIFQAILDAFDAFVHRSQRFL